MNDEFEKQLNREILESGASKQEADHLLNIARSLGAAPKLERQFIFKKQKFRKLFGDGEKKGLFSWPKIFIPAFAAILMLLVLGGGVVLASQKSFPGEPLYGVKRASESVRAIIRPEFKEEIVVKRGEEIKEIVERKEDPKLLRDSLDELREEARKNRGRGRTQESLERLEEAKRRSSGDEKDEIEKTVEEIRRGRDDDSNDDEDESKDNVKGEKSAEQEQDDD